MAEKRCPDYCGITCVNSHCPNILADEYPEFGYRHCSCDECPYYLGCENCYFDGRCEHRPGSERSTI